MRLKYSTAPISVSAVGKVLVMRLYYYSHYYTSSKSKGQTGDVVSSPQNHCAFSQREVNKDRKIK